MDRRNNFRKLYGVRWQIELVFKNWKSNFNLDKISGIRKERAKCMLYTRLLLIFLSTKIIFQLRNIYWIENHQEISEVKASKHLILVFSEILKFTAIKLHNKIDELLHQSIQFINQNCVKLRQRNRSYTLDIINSIS